MNDREIRKLLGLSRAEWDDMSKKKRDRIRNLLNTPAGWMVAQAVTQARRFFLEQVAK